MGRKRFAKEAGASLLEVIFVIAIIGVLAAIFLPLAFNMLGNDSRTTQADAEIQAIAGALTGFLSDLKQFPTCDAADCSSTDRNLSFLAFGTGTGSLAGSYPDESGANWGTLSTKDSGTPSRNNAYNHLGQNDPDADGSAGGSNDYKTWKWKGPYMTKFNHDPYGRTYIAHVGAMQKGGSPVVSGGRGWILSAGSDNILQTGPTSTMPSGDDRGFIFSTSR